MDRGRILRRSGYTFSDFCQIVFYWFHDDPGDNLMNMDNLIALSVKHNASDLHLCVGQVPMLRVDGELFRRHTVRR